MPACTIRESSVWSAERIAGYLAGAIIPFRIAVLARHVPLICSLWFVYDDDKFWLATQRDAAVIDYLRVNPCCGFEVSDENIPYRGVRGQGRARLDEAAGAATLERLIRRYLGGTDSDFARWLMSRGDAEVAIVIEPDWLTSWDFSSRMQTGSDSARETAQRG